MSNVGSRSKPEGGTTGLFRHHDGDYRVWFHGPERGERAYRIRSQHAYPTISYVELLAELAAPVTRAVTSSIVHRMSISTSGQGSSSAAERA